ncbi:F-box domain protein [Pandoravirus inopinatum]|uniref:F-box domain protein n=1 Tax=Pandoravirus inopinatum TaxID=1605721 RepID=A0A0B5J9A2_9VIRU|nr:F-box domain protein [Pandoravirus inopinatum]AJF97431.1 F-box domain protein [Pandoravirus inopinatum]
MQEHDPMTGLAALPEEILMAILALCGPRDLCHLSAVGPVLRRLALDERLWKPHYKRAVARCYGMPEQCLARGGDQLGKVDLFACVIAAADRLLDTGTRMIDTDGLIPRVVRRLCRDVPQQSCRHHWPSVIHARGYRWAYAVATVKQPRWFGPHLDGSPAGLVGRVERDGFLCCGDFVRIRGKYKPHGYATCDGMSHKCSCGLTRSIIRKVSGRWTHGVPTGPVVGWMPLQKKKADYWRTGSACVCRGWYESYVTYTDDRALFLQAGYGPHGLEGPGVVIGSKAMRACQWVRGQPTDVVTLYKSLAEEVCTDGRPGSRVRGTLRVHGLLGFHGTIKSKSTAHEGDFLGPDGNVLFRGDLGTGKGRIYADNGLVLKCDAWDRDWHPDQDRPGPGKASISVYYANGDKAVWACAGRQPVLTRFVAGGVSYEPTLGWHVVTLPDVNTAKSTDHCDRQRRRTLVLDDGRIWSSSWRLEQIQWPDKVIDLDLVFWPRINSTRFVDQVLQFVDHMIANHRAEPWTRCRKAVCAFYGLD